MGSQECWTMGDRSLGRGVLDPIQRKAPHWCRCPSPLQPTPWTPEIFGPVKGGYLSIQKRAIEAVKDMNSKEFYNCLFILPKSLGGWRPVLD